ncbi:ABC transporter substrate-binding protein [Marinobacterium rhizophilum]|uniref:ABC transporter substrate-binding protein n=1 Tax=Marinobacterium rhizophilum TaxID=420402 RepID=UPI0009FD6F2F|nr:extracellular solute-binding protein [Marinobacterium rhizophilum]
MKTIGHLMKRTSLYILTALVAAPAIAQDSAYYQAAVEEAARIAKGYDLSGYVEFIGQNSGAEGQTLQKVYAAFTQGAGVEIRYTGTADTTAIIQSRIQAGNPPDVGELQLGIAAEYAHQGLTLDLTELMGESLSRNFNEQLLETTIFDGKVFGLYQGMNPFMVWYNPETYTGPKDPTDWKELADWTIAEAEKGNAVWCAAQGAGAASGFPGAQIIDNIFLKTYGPELYEQWGSGELPWTSDEVKGAFEEFGRVVATDTHLLGGNVGAISTSIATGYNGLISEPAACQVSLWGAWVPGLLGENARPGENIAFYRVPAVNSAFYGYELFQAATSIGLTDRPETKAFLEFMASTPAQTYLASLNRWPVANKNVPSDAYSSSVLQSISESYVSAGDVQFAVGPNALLSGGGTSAYYRAVVEYMRSPGKLDAILADVQAAVE